MSRESRKSLIEELSFEVRHNQSVVDAFDEAAADHLGVNRTDLRCLDLLLQELSGSATPGQLGSRLGLSTGSVTAMIDRLERIGFVTRSPDPSDRRKVVVRPTEAVSMKVGQIYGPLASEGAKMLTRYTVEELKLLTDFVRRNTALQQQHLQRLRG